MDPNSFFDYSFSLTHTHTLSLSHSQEWGAHEQPTRACNPSRHSLPGCSFLSSSLTYHQPLSLPLAPAFVRDWKQLFARAGRFW